MFSIRLKELLNIGIFKESKVLAGAEKMDNEVLSINILEAPDGYHYMGEGTLVITTGYSFLKDTQLQTTILERLAEQKVAALGIMLRYFNHQLPKIMIDKANELKLPIISIPDFHPFKDILDDFNSSIICRQTNKFLSKEGTYDLFLNAVAREGIKGVVKTINNITNLKVAFVSQQEKIEYPEKFLPENFDEIINICSKKEKIFEKRYKHSEKFYKCFYECPREGKKYQWSYVEIIINPLTTVNIILWIEDRDLDQYDYWLLEYSALICRMELQKQLLLKKEEFDLKSKLLEEILQGGHVKDELSIRALALRSTLPEEAGVCIINFLSKIEKFNIELLNKIEIFFRDRFKENILLGIYRNNIVILIPKELYSNKVIYKEIADFLNHLFKEVSSKIDYYISIGTLCEFKNLNISYKEAEYTGKTSKIFKNKSKINFFNKLGVYRIFLDYEKNLELKNYYLDYLKPIVIFDQENNTNLVETLLMFLKNGCNYSTTAKQLFLHPNSIRYRIRSIEKICDINLKDDKERFNIELAFRIAPLVEDDLKLSYLLTGKEEV